jgi:DNA-binding SARP family transcriptional activator
LHVAVQSRIQLCGSFVVELAGRRVDPRLPGRQGRVLLACLALARPAPVPREVLIDALWGDRPPTSAGPALAVLISKSRAALGADVLRGRGDPRLVLPEPAEVDVEEALAALHEAESGLVTGNSRAAWSAALTAAFVASRPFLPDADSPWVRSWRRRLGDVHVRALECYAEACLQLGGAELPAAERTARQIVEIAPLRETGHLLLMRALAAHGNVAEALRAYEHLREVLREELGVRPCQQAQELFAELLG